jgi:CRP-like cAMP-binding protein
MIELIDIRRAWLFEGLTEDEVAVLSAAVEYRRCPTGSVVVESGTVGRTLFIVYSGSVRIVRIGSGGQELPLSEVLPGQHFGEVSFIDGGVRSATAITNEPTELLVVEERSFARLSQSHPHIAQKMLLALTRLLCGRLRNADQWIYTLLDRRERAEIAS